MGGVLGDVAVTALLLQVHVVVAGWLDCRSVTSSRGSVRPFGHVGVRLGAFGLGVLAAAAFGPGLR
jgi:hypothetical protein